MYKCPGCGAALRFDPKTQKMVCTHCNQALSPKDERLIHMNQASGAENALPHPDQNPSYQSVVFTCPNCGGTLLSTDETAATFCSYCGSGVVLEGKLEEMEAPDVIIPFQLDKEDCKAAYKRLLRRSLFAPNYMKADAEIDKFRGIYMPYWIYGFYADGHTSGSGSTTHREGNYIVTDYYRVERDVQGGYEGISYDAASGFSDVMSNAIAPFHAAGAEEFVPTYMSGFYADVSDVPDQIYEEDAGNVARDYFAVRTADTVEHSAHGVGSKDVRDSIPMISGQIFKGYFPVWFLANRLKGTKLVSYAVVNGETGRIAADLPIAFWKYVLGSLLLAIPLFLLFNLFLTLSPQAALIGSILCTVISFFTLNSQLNKAYSAINQSGDKGQKYKEKQVRAQAESDPAAARQEAKSEQKSTEKKQTRKGGLIALFIIAGFVLLIFLSVVSEQFDPVIIRFLPMLIGVAAAVVFIVSSIVRNVGKKSIGAPVEKAPIGKKSKYLWKPIVGIVASAIVLFVHPVSDVPYYIVLILAELLIIWCAFETVALHNKGSFRPLPQFEKRGGTGNE